MRRKVSLFLALSVVLVAVASYGARTARTQSPIGLGRILTPVRGQAFEAGIPVALIWQLDNATEVESQDLILSTDGGTTFRTMIAAHLPAGQQQLTWAAATPNVTGLAKLQVLLRHTNGQISVIISDDFSIIPPRAGSLSTTAGRKKSSGASAGVEPAFAGTGSCVSGTLPTLNYNMGNTSLGRSYNWGEPALSQDPNDPSHFFTATGSFTRAAQINSTGVNWQFSGTATFSPFTMPFGFAMGGDLTTEIGVDGKVYVVAIASGPSSGGSFDTLMIFRSTTGGATFEPGVAIPKPAEAAFVDKPVIAVHPNDRQTLVITFDNTDSSATSTFNHWLAICNRAATGSLADSTIWSFTKPLTQSAFPLPINFTLHPLIDPVSPTSSFYWLFLVQTNENIGPGNNTGYRVEQYQVTNRASSDWLSQLDQQQPGLHGNRTSSSRIGMRTELLPG